MYHSGCGVALYQKRCKPVFHYATRSSIRYNLHLFWLYSQINQWINQPGSSSARLWQAASQHHVQSALIISPWRRPHWLMSSSYVCKIWYLNKSPAQHEHHLISTQTLLVLLFPSCRSSRLYFPPTSNLRSPLYLLVFLPLVLHPPAQPTLSPPLPRGRQVR